MLKKQVSPKVVAIVFGVIVVCFAIVVYVSAQWTEPTCDPNIDPGACNVPPPLNTGDEGQIKTGALRLGGLTVDNDTYLATSAGNVGIGTPSPSEKLDIVGNINVAGNIQVGPSSDVCISGGNCLSDTGGAGSAITCQSFAGAAPVGDLCPDCYFENRNDMDAYGNRFLISSDVASTVHRCIELGYDWGYATDTYKLVEWCSYSNARTKRWAGTWVIGTGVGGFGNVRCENYAVKSAMCCNF